MKRLPEVNYPLLLSALKEIKINHFFARSVLEGRVNGVVYVDNSNFPRVFYVKHPYGMSLVFGNKDVFVNWESFWSYLQAYSHSEVKDEWLQAWPEPLATEFENKCRAFVNARAPEALEMIEKHTRVNFSFNRLAFTGPDETFLNSDAISIRKTRQDDYDQFHGSVIPHYFWKGRDAFLRDGIGFSLLCEGIVTSTAFSAFIHDQKLELGIETRKEFQGRGFAYGVCSHLIQYCLEMGYEPVWSCRLENRGSFRLAEKLGFKAFQFLPYFRIKGSASRAQSNAGW